MKNLMERVINEVTDHKAEADLILSSSKALNLSSQKGEISSFKVSSSQMLGIRVIKEGRVGIAYTESMDEDSLKLLISQALQNAETTEPNEHERILHLSGSLEDVASYQEGGIL